MVMADNKVLKLMEQAPLPQMIKSLSQSVADAQNELTMKAVESLIVMADEKNGVMLPGDTQKRSLLELGFTPVFLHISETTIKARVAFTQTEGNEWSVGGSVGVTYGIFSASINASYSAKYSFETQGSSEITTRIISVPPPLLLTARLNQVAKRGN
jgi:hypothetical protein